MRNGCILATVALSLVIPTMAAEPDLLAVERLPVKGRVQDSPSDPTVSAILELDADAIPYLIDRLSSERPSENRPMDFWPVILEGDLALVILSDLFLDPTWMRSTLPELCWDRILKRTSPDLPSWQLLSDFVAENGRGAIEDQWRSVFATYKDRIVWDESDRFFRVSGLDLEACR